MCSGGLSAHRFKDVDGLLHTGFHLALDRLPFGCEGVLAALCNLVEEIGQAVRVVNAGGLAPAVDGAEVIHAVVKQDIEHLLGLVVLQRALLQNRFVIRILDGFVACGVEHLQRQRDVLGRSGRGW